jgi:hypothetical protein
VAVACLALAEPSLRPDSTGTIPPTTRPTVTGLAWNVFGSPATGTNTAGLPPTVCTAPSGTASAKGDAGAAAEISTRADMPGRIAPDSLGTSTRTRPVRVSGSSDAATWETVASTTLSADEASRTRAGAPTATSPSRASGTSASTQAVERSATIARASRSGVTRSPSATRRSTTVPARGDRTASRGSILPDSARASIVASSKPSSRSLFRAPRSAASAVRAAPAAATHSASRRWRSATEIPSLCCRSACPRS